MSQIEHSPLTSADGALAVAVRGLLDGATSAKNALRRCLMTSFPVAYEILFTRGNFDESIPALIAGHRAILRLMSHPGLRPLVADYPPMIYRPYRMYLASSFTKKARRAALEQHYAYLLPRVSRTFFWKF
jgi:hypothetical protein